MLRYKTREKRHLTEEHKHILSITHRYNEYASKPIYCIELDTVFRSGREAERVLGVSAQAISHALHGWSMSAGGYHWQFATTEITNTQTKLF